MRGTTTGSDGADIEENGKTRGGTILSAKMIDGRRTKKRTILIAPPLGAILRPIGNSPLPARGGAGRGKRLGLPRVSRIPGRIPAGVTLFGLECH